MKFQDYKLPLMIVCLIGASVGALAYAQHPAPANVQWGSFAMQKSMDPAAYENMFKMLAENPSVVTDPTPMCAQCHDQEALERYRTTIFPMYQLMMNPANWMNPNAYTQAMVPMMDPATYTAWFNAMMKMMEPGNNTGTPQTEDSE